MRHLGFSLILGLLGLTGLTGLTACSKAPADPKAQVKATLTALEEAAEARDIDAVLEHLAPDYRDGRGRGPSHVRSMLQLHFLRQGSVHALVRIDELRFPSADRAEADLDVALAATPSEEGSLDDLRADWIEVKLVLARDGDTWKIQKASWDRGELIP